MEVYLLTINKMKIKIVLFIFLSVMNVAVSSGQKGNKKVLIMGIVTDTLQRPVVGAIILIDGKSTDAITSSDGVFKLKVRSDADSLTIFAAGNRMSTVPIMGRKRIDFILDVADQPKKDIRDDQVNDKQVDVGYGTVSEKNLLTRVSTIDGRANNYSSYKDIYEILKGTPGVIVRGKSIQIDGPSSMFSGTEPLFVVDGMAVGSIDGITPIMVQSISVLKGSSTAIYGSRGANGVILINLNKGTEKKKSK